MQFIHLNNISYCYENQFQPVFQNVAFAIAAGERIALIGSNGSGKTTLIRIVMEELRDYRGNIFYPLEKPVIGYLPQDTTLFSGQTVRKELLAGRQDIFGIIIQLERLMEYNSLSEKDGLRVAELWEEFHRLKGNDYLTRIDTIMAEIKMTGLAAVNCQDISEGEKTRLQLGKLLVKDPEILILDEPTNHLDLENMLWLEKWLSEFPGAVLIVSHDRVFLNHVATKVVELKRGEATIRAGNYEVFTENKEMDEAHCLVQYRERNKLISQLQQAARKRRQWASSFQPDTKTEGGGKVFESIFNPVRTMHQQAKNIEMRIEMLQNRYPIEKPWKDKERKIKFSDSGLSSAILVSCSELGKSYGDKIVFKNLYFYAGKGEKIWLSGVNGSGKTSLIRILAGIDRDYQGELTYGQRVRCGFFDQALSQLPLSLTPLQYTEEEGKDEQELRTLFGCLGLQTETVKRRISTLSWGERTKTQLVKLLSADYNLLLLDEPTNHLDIASRQMLEEALRAYTGTVIFVSHDRAFISHLATREFSMNK
jgi:ATP-binding cassette subfamily F protein 3